MGRGYSADHCSQCGHEESTVYDSRYASGYRMRRRKCPLCKHRWKTYEVSAEFVDHLIATRRAFEKLQASVDTMAALISTGNIPELPQEKDSE